MHSMHLFAQTMIQHQFHNSENCFCFAMMTHLKQRPRDFSPESNTRLKESLNTECPKLSERTTRPPVLSTATFISATPT